MDPEYKLGHFQNILKPTQGNGGKYTVFWEVNTRVYYLLW